MVKKQQKPKAQAKRYFDYTPEEINDRFVDHWELAEHFVTGFLCASGRGGSNLAIDVNPRRLRLVIASAYKDVARYKNFHQRDPWVERLDCVKRCAYLAKWIVRVKPLIVIGDESDLANDVDQANLDEAELINEFFVLYLFENHLSTEIGKNISLSLDKAWDLAYDLIYREISVDGWISIFQLVKDCCAPKIVKGVPFITQIRLT